MTGAHHLVAAQLVADDRGRGHQVIAVRVIAVMVRVDERSQRERRDRPDRVDERPGSPLGEAGVDHCHGVAADEEAAVVQAPGYVELDLGVHAVADFLDRRRRKIRMIVIVMRSAHGTRASRNPDD